MISLPIFFENSAVPKILSKVSPISIGAITVGPVVFCDGEISESLKRHESIHWEQYKECLIIGFLLLYAFFLQDQVNKVQQMRCQERCTESRMTQRVK